MKKYIVGLLSAFLILGSVSVAQAATLDDLWNQVSTLRQQIIELRSELGAAVSRAITSTAALKVISPDYQPVTEAQVLTKTTPSVTANAVLMPATTFTATVGSAVVPVNPAPTPAQGPIIIPGGVQQTVLYMLGGLSFNGPVNSQAPPLNDVYKSTDGENWQLISADTANPVNKWNRTDTSGIGVYFNGYLWIIGGSDCPAIYGPCAPVTNHVWRSSDGITWTKMANAPWLARRGHTVTVFDNKIWVMGGDTAYSLVSDVWSFDGTTWTQASPQAPWQPRFVSQSIVFNGKLWVIGGQAVQNNSQISLSDTWSSTNGVTWTQGAASSGWGPSVNFSALVFQNKMWVLGGAFMIPGSHSGVWSSTDGVTWTQVQANPAWLYAAQNTTNGRQGLQSYVLNNKMYVLGGSPGQLSYNANQDIWSSVDGVNWTQSVVPGISTRRTQHIVITGKQPVQVFSSGTSGPILWQGNPTRPLTPTVQSLLVKPDLIVDSFSWTPQSPRVTSINPVTAPTPNPNPNFQFTVRIKNIGTAPAVLPRETEVSVSSGGISYGATNFFYGSITLQPGQTYDVVVYQTANPNILATARTLTLVATVDAYGSGTTYKMVDESDETNNTLNKVFTILP